MSVLEKPHLNPEEYLALEREAEKRHESMKGVLLLGLLGGQTQATDCLPPERCYP